MLPYIAMVKKRRSHEERIDDGTLAKLTGLSDDALAAEKGRLEALKDNQGLDTEALRQLRAIRGIIAERRLTLREPLS